MLFIQTDGDSLTESEENSIIKTMKKKKKRFEKYNGVCNIRNIIFGIVKYWNFLETLGFNFDAKESDITSKRL